MLIDVLILQIHKGKYNYKKKKKKIVENYRLEVIIALVYLTFLVTL